MYKSPIELYTTDLQTKINEQAEGMIMEAVKGIGVDVNKEELTRALQYDRHQYEKGYTDGMKEFAERLRKTMTATSKTISGYCKYIVTDDEIDNLLEEMEGDS